MKVRVTKYALSAGIKEIDADTTSQDGMICEVGVWWSTYYHGEGKDWHMTREGAEVRAEQMRVAKIASLKKQIAKLEKLKFAASTGEQEGK